MHYHKYLINQIKKHIKTSKKRRKPAEIRHFLHFRTQNRAQNPIFNPSKPQNSQYQINIIIIVNTTNYFIFIINKFNKIHKENRP